MLRCVRDEKVSALGRCGDVVNQPSCGGSLSSGDKKAANLMLDQPSAAAAPADALCLRPIDGVMFDATNRRRRSARCRCVPEQRKVTGVVPRDIDEGWRLQGGSSWPCRAERKRVQAMSGYRVGYVVGCLSTESYRTPGELGEGTT
jgi:hypothetical protein